MGDVMKFSEEQIMPREQAKKILTTLAFLNKQPSSAPLPFAHETKQQFPANIK